MGNVMEIRFLLKMGFQKNMEIMLVEIGLEIEDLNPGAIGMGLLRSVKDGAVPMDGHQLNGANRGMERNVGQEARLNVVKMLKIEATWQKYQMAFKRLRIGKSRRAPEPKKYKKIKQNTKLYQYVNFFAWINFVYFVEI